jgi:FixJ family two-component response regulator
LGGKIPLVSIIDDDEAVLDATARFVRSLGYAAETYGCAEDYLRSGHIAASDCVITDLQMPGLSGVDLQARIASNGHRIPVIIMTAYADDAVRKRALDAGAFDFLSKPIEGNSLIASLDKALKH